MLKLILSVACLCAGSGCAVVPACPPQPLAFAQNQSDVDQAARMQREFDRIMSGRGCRARG